jgi:hypothetical protein
VIKFCCRNISIGIVGYLTSSMLDAINSSLLGAIKSHTCMPPISSRPSAA